MSKLRRARDFAEVLIEREGLTTTIECLPSAENVRMTSAL
jgi:hypothetical protein